MTPPPFLWASTALLLNLVFIENGYLKRPNVDNKTVLHTEYCSSVLGAYQWALRSTVYAHSHVENYLD